MAMTVLVVVALSSYAQCLFGLDGAGGWSRYRLLPLRGWQILAAKDAAFLLVTAVLVAPLAPLAGMGAALVALAMGGGRSGGSAPADALAVLGGGIADLWRGGGDAMASAASAIFFTSALIAIPCLGRGWGRCGGTAADGGSGVRAAKQ